VKQETESFAFYPAPRNTRPLEGLAQPVTALRCGPASAEALRRFLAAWGLAMPVEPDVSLPPGTLGAAVARPQAEPRKGGYTLRLAPEGVALRWADHDGFYAGLQTLAQVLEMARPVSATEIEDWPAVRVRSFQVDLGRQPETAAELKRLLRQQARYHYNECQLYLENALQLPAFGEAANPDGLSLADFRSVQDLGRDLGIDVVPSLNLLGHMENLLRHPAFAHLSETAQGARHPRQAGVNCVCPELPEAREWVSRILRETAEASLSPKLMVGLDECWSLGSHPLTRARLDADGGAGEVFRDWILFLHREVTRAGKQMWMWEDMLFYHHGALGRIPADIGMNEWHYQHLEEYPQYSFQNWRRLDALGILRGHGHPVMLCCGPDPSHLVSMLRYAEGHGLDGVLVVQWEGSGVVQELYHAGRAVAGAVLWSGRLGSFTETARALCGPADAERVGQGLALETFRPHPRGDRAGACPRFWSWPEVLPAIAQREATLALLSGPEDPAIAVPRLFLERERNGMVCDWARETAALAGRRLLQSGGRESPALDESLDRLREAAASAERLVPQAEAVHARYAAGLRERPMAAGFRAGAAACRGLLDRLERFRAAPGQDTWPFPRASLHVDGLTLDPCAHYLRVLLPEDAAGWKPLYEGSVRLPPSLEGEFVMSWALESVPRRVRVEVGGFAALGLTRVRLETLEGTFLPARVVAHGGDCLHPEHLLVFDRTVATFNAPVVLPEWRSLQPPACNFVELEWE
jgi:hypothetical protein